MTRFAVTGGGGFLGWHICVGLHARGHQVVPVTRTESSDASRYLAIVASSDVVVHGAGVNRAASDAALRQGNLAAADELIAALAATPNDLRPRQLVFLNSVRAEDESPYGQAKREVSQLLERCAEKLGIDFVDLLLPHVFGEFGRPHYNSAVATFAADLAQGNPSEINPAGSVELVHAQRVTELVCASAATPSPGASRQRVHGEPLAVSMLHQRMAHLHERYVGDLTVPDLGDPLDLRLFNTIRAALFVHDYYPKPVVQHRDERGWFAELVRADGTGQTSYSSTGPGVVRGDHYHFDKVERFIVVEGDAELRIRRMFTAGVTIFELSGSEPQIVDIPTMCTHNITNVGDNALVTLFWAGDHFDPNVPDTYVETVETVDTVETAPTP